MNGGTLNFSECGYDRDYNTCNNERYGKTLPHIQEHIVFKFHLRFLDEFDDESHSEASDKKYSKKCATMHPVQFPDIGRQHSQAEQEITRRLIQLRRMLGFSLSVEGEYELDFNATTFATQSHLTANSTGSPNYPLTNDPSRNNSLSSIVDFYVFFQKDVQVSNQKISLSKAENENNRDINDKEICNFIDKNDDIVESKSINLVSFNAKDIAVDGVSEIYVMLDYNEENCAKMYGNNIGNTAIEKGHFLRKGTDLPILKFDADFEFDLIMK